MTAAACIPPLTEMLVKVRSERAGLSLIRPVQRRRSPVFVANGLVEIPGDRQREVWMANFPDKPAMVTRGQVVGVAEVPPE
jgi:hypothetical protein